MNIPKQDQRTAFSIWMRTGRWPRVKTESSVEHKFNPWHDREDGRFTFAGAGEYVGGGGASSTNRRAQRAPKVRYIKDSSLPTVGSMSEVEVWKAEQLAKHGNNPDYRKAIEERYQQYKEYFAKAASLNELGKIAGNATGNDSAGSAGFAGSGGSFGGAGATGTWGDDRPVDGGKGFGGSGGFGSAGATGSWEAHGIAPGGGSFGSGGATGSWDNPPFARGNFGSGGSTGKWKRAPSQASPKRHASNERNSSFRGAGATGSWAGPSDNSEKFGGGGATGSWSASHNKKPHSETNARRFSHPPTHLERSTKRESFRTVERNGYEYRIDSIGRTRQVSGTLMLSETQVRSRTSQQQAGGSDRRHDDDGGHYIAARFNGPTDAFNHFAQNANFNRGVYRVLEDQWAQEQRVGKRVTVRIVPRFEGSSQRPSAVDVWFTVDGRESSLKFRNEFRGEKRAKH